VIAILLAVGIATAQPPASILDEAAHAIQVERLEEARLILQNALREGYSGYRVDRLLADLAFEKGDYAEAESRYASLLRLHPENAAVAERAGIAALKAGDYTQARILVSKAVSLPGASWRAWNAQGVMCDMERDWACADRAYAEAFVLSPEQPDLLNNKGWSLMLRGEPARALELFEDAAEIDSSDARISNNRELARAAIAKDLPQRQPNESDSAFAARLNDAGMVAEQQGDNARAIAAFSQAVAVNDTWFARAANNLKEAEAR
jgi:Flp pilus assembly protein TadD